MEKILIVLLSMVSILTACTTLPQNTIFENSLTIKMSEFSEETQEVLELFDDEIIFFDYTIDDSVKSSKINIWIYENGEWVDKGESSGNIDKLNNQIAIRFTDNGYDIYSIDDSGHVKYSSPNMYTGFKDTIQQASQRIINPTKIEINKEIPLWVKIGNNENGISIEQDFRNSNCTAGFAVTITFSDKELK